MSEQQIPYRPPRGKTYTLFSGSAGTEEYYGAIRRLAGRFLEECPDEKELVSQIQQAGNLSFFKRRNKTVDRALISFIKKTLRDSLSAYTTGVKQHLRNLPITKRFDNTLTTTEDQYHLYMLEIEITNRIYKEPFRNSEYRFALFPHCLRDFRPECRSVQGDVESECRGCTKGCFIHLGSELLGKYNIKPYISVEMDQERLFRRLKTDHSSIGALGVACVPELARGMRLCISLGIPAVGIPLDANRCARWMKRTYESSFSLKELEELVR
ncbi:MAG TPA: DUF116 domain-containing protein [Thermodesulfovibrionales bacterium]|nr:DUF116 domain-containing protein [Thermodesulfovibrionales bacterium]